MNKLLHWAWLMVGLLAWCSGVEAQEREIQPVSVVGQSHAEWAAVQEMIDVELEKLRLLERMIELNTRSAGLESNAGIEVGSELTRQLREVLEIKAGLLRELEAIKRSKGESTPVTASPQAQPQTAGGVAAKPETPTGPDLRGKTSTVGPLVQLQCGCLASVHFHDGVLLLYHHHRRGRLTTQSLPVYQSAPAGWLVVAALSNGNTLIRDPNRDRFAVVK
jgi:hypothetical protein